MLQKHTIRIALIAACGLLPWGDTWTDSALQAKATSVFEVRVLDAQRLQAQGGGDEVLYRMEVVSVLRSNTQVEPGDSIAVRADAPSPAQTGRPPTLLAPGWMGVAYLDPDPSASGPEASAQFTIAANGDSFGDIPKGPPSATWIQWVEPEPAQSPPR